MNATRFFLLFALVLSATSCAEESGEKFDAEKFVRIYDYNGFAESFTPIDMVQTPDNGFLILANYRTQSDGIVRGVYLLRVDQFGNLMYDKFLDEEYVLALESLESIGGKYYFFCMDESSRAIMVETDADLQSFTFSQTPLSYPAAVSYAGTDGFLVLSYDQVNRKTVFSRMTLSGTLSTSRKFRTADDNSLEDVIIQHFLGAGRQFPFTVGKFSNGNYYFNGFYDYTFSFVTTGLADDDDVNQFVHGQHENGGFSAIVPLGANQFAASYFNFGSNYFVPRTSLPQGPASIGTLGGYHMRELVPNARVQIERVSAKGKSLLLYGTDVKSSQIALYFYDENTDVLSGSIYLGFSNPYELGKVVTTTDDGLAVCGTTYIAGRFPRICLFKLSREELERHVR